MKKLLTHGLLHFVFLILYSQWSKVEAQSTEIRSGILLPQMTTVAKRTNELRRTNEELRLKNEALEDRLAKIEKEWVGLRKMLTSNTTGNNSRTEK